MALLTSVAPLSFMVVLVVLQLLETSEGPLTWLTPVATLANMLDKVVVHKCPTTRQEGPTLVAQHFNFLHRRLILYRFNNPWQTHLYTGCQENTGALIHNNLFQTVIGQ